MQYKFVRPASGILVFCGGRRQAPKSSRPRLGAVKKVLAFYFLLE